MDEKYYEELVKIRRDIHQNPEPGMQEYQTAEYIKNYLKKLDIEIIGDGLGETGIVALIRGEKQSDRTVAFRADMDALPIEEETGLEFASTNKGMMHACGHDGHIAMLLITARILQEKKKNIKGNVVLIFQPGEEFSFGARKMIEDGLFELLDKFQLKVEAILALHLWMDFPSGEVRIKPGNMMAASDKILISIEGERTHGAMPHQGIDGIVAAGEVILALQTIMSREIDPAETAVLSLGKIEGGDSYNIIADKVELTGTLRTLKKDVRRQIIERIKQKTQSVVKSYRGKVNIEIQKMYPLTINNEEIVDVINKLSEVKVKRLEKPCLASEDFSYFLNRIPGAMAFIGARNDKKGLNRPLHHAEFNFDESALREGVKVLTGFAFSYLN
ncbi:MAG: M20 metallopeptidase family protein [Halanaerobiaceae bacterium]